MLPLVAAINHHRDVADHMTWQELDRVTDMSDVHADAYRRSAHRFAVASF